MGYWVVKIAYWIWIWVSGNGFANGLGVGSKWVNGFWVDWVSGRIMSMGIKEDNGYGYRLKNGK